MRVVRSSISFVIGLSLAAGLIAPAASVSAATASTGLSSMVGLPGTSWNGTLTTQPGQVVGVLITYINQNDSGQKFVLLRDMLPTGATLSSGSTYLFTNSIPRGAQQADTLTTSGVNTGNLQPGEKALIQFQITMPPATSLNCGNNTLTNRVEGASRTGNRTYSSSNAIVVVRNCATPPAPTPATTSTQTPITPSKAVTKYTDNSVNIVAVDNSINTANTTNNTYQAATPQVASATTAVATTTTAKTPTASTTTTATAPAATTQTAAAQTNTSNAKSLVNTGPGNIVVLFLLATLVGTVGSRLVLYRLLNS